MSGCGYCREPDTLRLVSARLMRCSACGFLQPVPRAARRAPTAATLAVPAGLAVGSVLREHYRLVEVLGRGAHGVTFLAQLEFVDSPCVVKVLPYRVAEASDGAVRRLRREASAGFRVDHPNVVRVLDGDVIDGIWYFATQYVDGVDLAAAVEGKLQLDWRQAVGVATDAALGLEAIHDAGLIHRDIKPGNLILGMDGHVRIADFGVAHFVSQQVELTGVGEPPRAGTLAYAAPEVLAQDQPVGPRSDLYSLGATLFELVTGRLPRGESVYRTMLASSAEPIAWPPDAPAGVPDWLVAAILRLLELVPERRFESAGALADYLARPGDAVRTKPTSPRGGYSQPRGLVVLPFENASKVAGDDWLGHALADHLARSLSLVPEAYVVAVAEFLNALERLEGLRPAPHGEQLLEAGRLVGAGTVVAGTFLRNEETIELRARVIRAGQEQPVEIEAVSGALPALADLELELLSRVTQLLGLAPPDVVPRMKAPSGDALAAAERFFSAQRSFLRGDYEAARRLGMEAIKLDASLGDALGLVGACYARMGRYDQAVEYHRQQERLALEEGNERLGAQAAANMGAMHYFRGEYDAAEECLRRAERSAERLGLTTELAQVRNNLGFVLLQLDRQAEAGEAFRQAIDTLKKYGALVALVGPYNGRGHVLREQKRYEEAREFFRRALALAQESDDTVNMGVAFMNLGRCALLQGRLADAKHELAVALNILEKTSFWNGLARVYEYMADLNLQLSNWAEAVRCAEKRIELAQRHSNSRMEAEARRQKAAALEQAARGTAAGGWPARVTAGEREKRTGP